MRRGSRDGPCGRSVRTRRPRATDAGRPVPPDQDGVTTPMSMSNGRTTTRFPKTRRSPQSTTPSGRLAAAVDAARPSRRLAALEALEGRTLFAAPTLTSVVTLGAGAGLAGVGNATEDTAYTISYSQLKAASDAA